LHLSNFSQIHLFYGIYRPKITKHIPESFKSIEPPKYSNIAT